MKIFFVTGNENKLKEARTILDNHEIEGILMDLSEIQAINVIDIVKNKAKNAFDKIQKPILVEDTGIYIKDWNDFPGALIKWMMKTVGCNGIYKMLSQFENKESYAETILCYYDGNEFQVFTGKINGKIVEPRGETNFGWDPIFEPQGFKKTFAEMSEQEKNHISMRKIALEKLNNFLKKN